MPQKVRTDLRIKKDERLILVITGNGEDGLRLLQTYITCLDYLPQKQSIRSVLIYGPEMPVDRQQKVWDLTTGRYPQITTFQCTDDLMSCVMRADLVLSMGEYGIMTEPRSAKKRAIIVPSMQPVEMPWARAAQMEDLGIFMAIHPRRLTPEYLAKTIWKKLTKRNLNHGSSQQLDQVAIPSIIQYITSRFEGNTTKPVTVLPAFQPGEECDR